MWWLRGGEVRGEWGLSDAAGGSVEQHRAARRAPRNWRVYTRFIVFGLLGWIGCRDPETPLPNGPEVGLRVYLHTYPTAIALLRFTVFDGDGQQLLSRVFEVRDFLVSETVRIPTGEERRLEVVGWNAAAEETHRGMQTVTIRDWGNPPVTIPLVPSGGAEPVALTLAEIAVIITPSVDSLEINDTLQLTAAVLDARGATLSIALVWTSEPGGRVDLTSAGLVTMQDTGLTRVFATTEGVRGEVAVVGRPSVFVGAGDIASCDSEGDEATATLLDTIPGVVFTVGDNAYLLGTPDEFTNCYGPSWGRHRERTRPSPGNHDYETPDAAGYFAYFGALAGPPGLGYYAYDVGAWRMISLNSNGSRPDQVLWLTSELAANPRTCTLAYWHHARFSSGPHGADPRMDEVIRLLYDAGVDVVLVGHDHIYERFARQAPDGQPDDERGFREFVTGTGGSGLYPLVTVAPNSEFRYNQGYGVLKFQLYRRGYEWAFVAADGGAIIDRGRDSCR